MELERPPATLVTLGGSLVPGSCKSSTAPPVSQTQPHSQTEGAAPRVAPLERLPKPEVQRAEHPHYLTQSLDPVSPFQAQPPRQCWQSRHQTIPSSPACTGEKTTLGIAGFDTALAKADGKTSSHFQRNTRHFLMDQSHSLSLT